MFRYRDRGPTLLCFLIETQARGCSFQGVRRELGREDIFALYFFCSGGSDLIGFECAPPFTECCPTLHGETVLETSLWFFWNLHQGA